MEKIIAINIDGVETLNNIFVGASFKIEIVNPQIDSLADINENDIVILENSVKKITILTRFISFLENKLVLKKELECGLYIGLTKSYSSNYVSVDDKLYNSFISDVFYDYKKEIKANLREEYIEYISNCRFSNTKSGETYAKTLDDETLNSAFKSFAQNKFDKLFICDDSSIITAFFNEIKENPTYERCKSPLVMYIDYLCSRDFFSQKKAPLKQNDNVPMLQIINDDLNDSYTEDELAAILNDWYINADGDQTTPIRAFGLKYGKYISNSSAIVNKAPDVNTSYKTEVNKGVNLYKAINSRMYGLSFYNPNTTISREFEDDKPLQTIYFGAPGGGKSTKVKKDVIGNNPNFIRTTFHPDTDYASFVGCYKPQTDDTGHISYEFAPQAFAKAYVNAWKLYLDKESKNKIYYLDIEEINRGNCAQIFGDIFQLLDRKDDGFSDYPIDVDSDFANYLAKVFDESKDGISEKEIDICKNYKKNVGEISKITLPPNLHIVATMNTSDQSLFPMDSAFKRRWEWKYVPIDYVEANNFKLEIKTKSQSATEYYNWGSFLKAINGQIISDTGSPDKQLGTWFVKANNDNVITYEMFISKVMFYLMSDVYKDMVDKLFNGTNVSFDDVYNDKENVFVLQFLTDTLKLSKVSEDDSNEAKTKEQKTEEPSEQ